MIDTKVIKLYGGAVEVRFDQEKHRYTVRDLDDFDPEWRIYPSVTSILHTCVNKADVLTGWAVNCALEVFNASIAPGKVYDEVQLRTIAAAMKAARYVKKNKAADIGTISHEWIAKYLMEWIENGKPKKVPPFPNNPAARSCCTAACAWITKAGFQPTLSEKIIFSRRFGYIGTMDATSSTASVYDNPAIVDWKSSKGIYSEYYFQVAAYLNAVAEESGIDPLGFDRWVIRLGKEDGDFEEKKLARSDYQKDLDAFTGMIPGYHRLTELEKIWREKWRENRRA